MAVDMFLILDGLEGESHDKTYKDKVDVLSWSWSLNQTGNTHLGGGSGAGKVHVDDITVTKYVDNASPTLMTWCCNGKHIPKGKLICRKAGENPLEYITIELENILISNVGTGGSHGEERLTEHVRLNFGKFKFIYKKQDDKGGGKPKDASWNIMTNSPS